MPTPTHRRAVAPRCDRGDVVLGWLTKMVLVTAVIGALGFDVVSVGVAKMNVADDASAAALAASHTWGYSHHDLRQAYQAAVDSLPDPLSEKVEPQSFAIYPDGTVHLTVQRTAQTLLLHHVHQFDTWSVVSADGSGKSIG